jgi:DUF1680 family protein
MRFLKHVRIRGQMCLGFIVEIKRDSTEKANSRFLHAHMTKKDLLIGGWVSVGQSTNGVALY